MSVFNYYLSVVQNYAKFDGRARRSEYWYFFLFNVLISGVLGAIGNAVGFELLSTIYSVAVLLPSVGVAIRRMHDVGKSGWFILIPIYNLILCLTDGEKGDNQYGADPKAA